MSLRILSPIRKARGARGKPTQRRLEALNDQFSKVVSLDLQNGLKTFSKRVNYDKMADAVYSGKWENVYATIPTKVLPADIEASMRRLGISIEDASKVAVSNIPFGRGTDPDALLVSRNNPALSDYIDVRTGALIQNIDDNIQANVQSAVRVGIDQKQTAQEVADNIQTSGIGMNNRQFDSLERQKAQWKEAGWSKVRINKEVKVRTEQLIEQRCTMIARTEVSYGQNFAQLEVWSQAQQDGILSENATKIWVVDGNPCPVCRALSGDEIGINEMFTTIDGEEIAGPPQHPNCLCSLASGQS